MFLGIDVSTYFEELEHGAKYYSNGIECEPLSMFRDNGCNYMRIRIWNDPYDKDGNPYLAGNCDYSNFSKLAKLAMSKGYKILLDFHYSDFWADPGKQMIPKAWQGLDLDGICDAVYKYTFDTLTRAKSEGINVELVQIGNEITNGTLWPICRLIEHDGTKERTNYESLCKALKKGIEASKAVFPNIRTILHLERSYDQFVYNEFFTNMEKYGVNYDIIGASYYPYWHGTFEQFFANMSMCKNKFGKPIMVMELGYAFTLEDYIKTNNGGANLVVNKDNLDSFSFTKEFPLNEKGQANFVKGFLKLAYKNGIEGIFYWEPLWIPGDGICWASEAGEAYIHEEGKSQRNEWANQCLFDYAGNKLPAFDEFKI